jgi:sugar O-acyltransferase (sialic acid O-acetyltransferase NeuD family)
VSSKPGIILGVGGHAKVVADVLNLLGREILGFVTPDIEAGTEFCGKKILGDDDYIKSYSPDEVELINGVGSLPRKNLRCELADKMRKQGYRFTSIVHPDTVIGSDVSLDEGVQIMAGVVIQPGVKIGRDSIINTGTLIDHDCKIGDNCHIGPGVVFSGGVVIGSNTHLGTGTVVTEYRSIGGNCIVAAGSVVFKDILDGTILIQSKQNK